MPMTCVEVVRSPATSVNTFDTVLELGPPGGQFCGEIHGARTELRVAQIAAQAVTAEIGDHLHHGVIGVHADHDRAATGQGSFDRRRPVRPRSCCETGDRGGMHLRINPQGNRRTRPTRPNTVTSPDATDDHRHQLRPWTTRPQPPCLGRHRLVLAKRPTQRPHRRDLLLANHSSKRRPIRARRPEIL